MVAEKEKPKEIEITPEMIEAGVSAIHPDDTGLLSPSEEVSLIFVAMFRCWPGKDGCLDKKTKDGGD